MEKSRSNPKCLHWRFIITSHSKSNYKQTQNECIEREKRKINQPASQPITQSLIEKLPRYAAHGAAWRLMVHIGHIELVNIRRCISVEIREEQDSDYIRWVCVCVVRHWIIDGCYRKLKSLFSYIYTNMLVLNHRIGSICIWCDLDHSCNNFGT